MQDGEHHPDSPVERYLSLLERCLTGTLDQTGRVAFVPAKDSPEHAEWSALRPRLGADVALVRDVPYDPEVRSEGRDWPAEALTMVGLKRLRNVRFCVEQVLADAIPGDLLEAGVWRGGVGIFMRGLLAAHGDGQRRVWIADSFRGLPPPDLGGAAEDIGDLHWTREELAVSLSEVLDNFDRFGLLDHHLRVIEGWFESSLAQARIGPLAVLRADGDMFSSTWAILEHLEPKVSPGGFVIIDDYGAVAGCREAVDRYRSEHGISAEMHEIDWTGVFWRKPA